MDLLMRTARACWGLSARAWPTVKEATPFIMLLYAALLLVTSKG